MDINKLNNIAIKDYLASRNIYPVKEYRSYGMFHSPFRNDKTASLKVDYTKNVWFDFGINKGGTMIDFAMCFNDFSFSEALHSLEQDSITDKQTNIDTDSFSFHGKLEIRNILPISHPALVQYLQKRAINIAVAKEYCSEIHFHANAKAYFAIGFPNNKGGWVLRNEFFKGCTSQDVTTYLNEENPKQTCSLFEGFMDFISYQTMQTNKRLDESFIILNSLNNLPKIVSMLSNFKEIHSYLDNDQAGKNAIKLVDSFCKNLINKSLDFAKYKDLNEYLVSAKQVQENSLRVQAKRKPSKGLRR